MGRKVKDISGTRFGRLVVGTRTDNSASGAARWRVLCDCGVEKAVQGSTLTAGGTVSCGCYAREQAIKRNTTHGGTSSFEFSAWTSMRRRCLDKKHVAYERYGGQGITICERWGGFSFFLQDMGVCPFPHGSIDRLDNKKGYSAENCRGLLKSEQSKYRGNVVWLDGMTLPDAAHKHGIKETTLRRRVKAQWPYSELFRTPQEIGTRR